MPFAFWFLNVHYCIYTITGCVYWNGCAYINIYLNAVAGFVLQWSNLSSYITTTTSMNASRKHDRPCLRKVPWRRPACASVEITAVVRQGCLEMRHKSSVCTRATFGFMTQTYCSNYLDCDCDRRRKSIVPLMSQCFICLFRIYTQTSKVLLIYWFWSFLNLIYITASFLLYRLCVSDQPGQWKNTKSALKATEGSMKHTAWGRLSVCPVNEGRTLTSLWATIKQGNSPICQMVK